MPILEMFYTLQSKSPAEFELNALGVYLLGSLCFVVGALVEFAVVVLVDRVRSARTGDQKNKVETQQFYNTAKNPMNQSWFKERMGIDVWATNPRSSTEGKTVARKKKADIFTLSSTNGIDFAAFLMYFFLFCLFNSVYWFYYPQEMHL